MLIASSGRAEICDKKLLRNTLVVLLIIFWSQLEKILHSQKKGQSIDRHLYLVKHKSLPAHYHLLRYQLAFI